jgi:hypothetical protein
MNVGNGRQLDEIGLARDFGSPIEHSSFSADILRLVVTDDRVLIESDDWICSILQKLISKDKSYQTLIDTIECQ